MDMWSWGCVLLTGLLWLTLTVEGEIRCYCNDASCVRSGYLCKSTMGSCFAQLTYGDATTSVHGCAESLPEDDRAICNEEGDITKAKKATAEDEWPILMCCRDDMCNYMESLDMNLYVSTKSNGSILKGKSRPADGSESDGERSPERAVGYHTEDLWFKAAVIAVPIAGGFILILLVLLAVRVLRNDSRRHRQLVQMRQRHSLAKAQLYVADHFLPDSYSVGENSCSSNKTQPGSWTSLAGRDPGSAGTGGRGGSATSANSAKTAGIYKDVHIKMDHSKHGYEKIRPVSDVSATGGTSSSVILWTNCPPKPGEPPTVV